MKRDLQQEALAVSQLLDAYREQLGDDDKAVADAIDGQTGFHEVVDAVLNRLSLLEDHIEALVAQGRKLNNRNSRYKSQHQGLRAALLHAMDIAGLKRIERPAATVSCKAAPRTAIVSNQDELPAIFLIEQPRKVDLRALTAALKEAPVPGAELSNGGQTIAINPN